MKESEIEAIIEKLRVIKFEADKAEQEMNEELNRDYIEINELSNKLSKMMKENYALLSKNETLTQQNSILRGKLS